MGLASRLPKRSRSLRYVDISGRPARLTSAIVRPPQQRLSFSAYPSLTIRVLAPSDRNALGVIIITARTGIWVQANSMEHRGIRYAIKVGIARGQWCVAIHRPGDDLPTERTVFGTREEAKATARSMISALLKKATRPENAGSP